MASTLLRTTVKQRLVSVIQTALTGVTVAYCYPGATTPNEVVFLGNTEGDLEIATMRGAGVRRHRSDTFDVVVVVIVSKIGQTALQVEQRCEELLAGIEDALASATVGPTLGSPTIDGLLWAKVGALRGPESWPNEDGNGHKAVGEIVVSVATRLT